MRMTMLMFSNLARTRESLILFAFGLFPLVLLVVNLFDTQFMQIGGQSGSVSCLDFLAGVVNLQHTMLLPMIVMFYLACTLLHQEIASGRLFLYKDMPRSTVFGAKIGALLGVYVCYMLLLSAVSVILYFLYLTRFEYASGTMLPASPSDVQSDVLSIGGTVLVAVMCMLASAALSVRCSSGVTMLGGVLLMLIATIAPMLPSLRYIMPTGYVALQEQLGFGAACGAMVAVGALYSAALYAVGRSLFAKVEY